jgi:ABC-type molybdate transport system substrate-binding protein
LPAQINLGDIALTSEYASASVEIGSGAHSRRIEGARIAYGVTLTSDPPNRGAAIDFLRLMATESGRAAAKRSGLVAYPQSFAVDPVGKMPPELKALSRPLNR